MKTSLLIAAVLTLGAQLMAADLTKQPGYLKSELIYEDAPFPSCHASTIVESQGELVAAWFGGTKESDPDVGIWLSRHEDGKWTTPIEVVNGVQKNPEEGKPKRYACWNPVLFQPRQGPLMLFYKVGPDPRTWWGMITTSEDGGRTWAEPWYLPNTLLGPIKNKPVQLTNGDILCPTSSEHDGWRVHFERSSDGGRSWTKSSPVNDGKAIGAIQPSVLLLDGEKLLALGRTRQKRVFQVASEDNGRTWGEMTLTSLPNPNSGTDAVTLKDGRHLLVYNHTERGRSPLNLAVSKDGKTWQAALVLEDEKGEFSYPAIIQTSDGQVHITYTWKRLRVKHVVVDPKKLQLREMPEGNWPE